MLSFNTLSQYYTVMFLCLFFLIHTISECVYKNIFTMNFQPHLRLLTFWTLCLFFLFFFFFLCFFLSLMVFLVTITDCLRKTITIAQRLIKRNPKWCDTMNYLSPRKYIIWILMEHEELDWATKITDLVKIDRW